LRKGRWRKVIALGLRLKVGGEIKLASGLGCLQIVAEGIHNCSDEPPENDETKANPCKGDGFGLWNIKNRKKKNENIFTDPDCVDRNGHHHDKEGQGYDQKIAVKRGLDIERFSDNEKGRNNGCL